MGIKENVRLELLPAYVLVDTLESDTVLYEFKEHLRSAGSQLTITNVQFTDDIDIKRGLQKKHTEIRFVNCHFQNESRLSGFLQLTFDCCTFDKTHWLLYDNDRATYMRSHFLTGPNITSYTRLVQLYVSECQIDESFSVNNCTVMSCLMKRCTGKEVLFEMVTIQDFLSVEGMNIGSLQLHQASITGFAHITGCHIGTFIFVGAKPSSKLSIEKMKGEVIHIAAEIEGLLAFNSVNFKTVVVSLHKVNGMKIYGGKYEKLVFEGRIPKEGFFSISESSAKSITLRQVKNMGTMEFNQLIVYENVQFESSDLGKCDFILCSFLEARCSFTNSKFNEIFLAETDFPERIYSQDKTDFVQEQLAFGQLRNVYERMGDTARSLEYHSRELHAQYQLLKWKSKVIPWINFTKLNLFLNYVSNDFGRNWARAVLVSFSTGVFLFYLLTISTNRYHFGWPISFNSGLVTSFLKFMNPLRTFDTENIFSFKVGITWKASLIDFAARILIAYCYYQVIQAFRRYGRK